MDFNTHYLEEIRRQLRGHKRMAEAAMAQLDDKEFFTAIDPEANSVAVIAQHIAGNGRSRFRDFLTTDGEKPDRFRDREFEVETGASRDEVMRRWEEGWATVLGTVESMTPEDVSRTITIRQEPHTVVQALNRALAHYAQHIGQIVFLSKHLRSTNWKTLSIPRGKSEEFNRAGSEKFSRGTYKT